MPGPYSRETIDAKLDAIRADVRALDAKLSGQIVALDSKLSGQIVALDSKLSGQISSSEARLEGKIDGLRTEMRIWILIIGLVVSPVVAGIGARVATSVLPAPGPAQNGLR
ncbi:MAG: hypothetical protein FJZ01_17850 [Candidatus Sericytochromatia bacterium]|nr:hypothetical protein [Candidatus Tanganyikabacteria bacterium]